MARGLAAHYADGVCLVELAPLTSGTLVPEAIAAALHVREEPGRSLSETLVEHLAERQLLLVLDNCEHVVAACAEIAERLLHACRDLRILATSREVLRAEGEVTWRLSPLSLPDPDGYPAVADLLHSEAGALFVERARAADPSFGLSPANAALVGTICRGLDGLPLALELAAAPPDLPVRAAALWTDAHLAWNLGDVAGCERALTEGLELARRIEAAAPALPRLMAGLSSVYAARGDLVTAEALAQDAVEGASRLGDDFGEGFASFWHGQIARAQGDHARARADFEHCASLLRAAGDRRHLGYVLWSLGLVDQATGDLDQAFGVYVEALTIARGLLDPLGILYAAEGLTWALAAKGQARLAAQLLGAVEPWRARLRATADIVPGWTAARDRAVDLVHRRLGSAGLTRALASGRRLGLETVLAEVLGGARPVRGQPTRLSPRERQVASLIAGGLSNRQIARELVIAESTVQRHVATVLAKLGCDSRAQVVVWVLKSDGVD